MTRTKFNAMALRISQRPWPVHALLPPALAMDSCVSNNTGQSLKRLIDQEGRDENTITSDWLWLHILHTKLDRSAKVTGAIIKATKRCQLHRALAEPPLQEKTPNG